VVNIDASEVRTLAIDLSAAPARIQRRASTAIRKTAHDIEADAKIFAPVDTGNLRNSISSDIHELSAVIGPTANYGGYVELGTSRMSPEPYMRPAFDRRAPLLERALGQAAEESVL
jgi:HK97 gp10 family phage protein